MGVPSFYKWLVGKYPKIVMGAEEETGDSVDTSLPNPNRLEFDNLYLDMNGIIHPCFHPDDQFPPPSTFEEVFRSMFYYIDRIFRIVRPRKLVYMAIDGVAPRAKMNQQRSRRYKTVKDLELADAEEEKLRKQFQAEGIELLPKQKSEVSDSNVITPGTVFMAKLSTALEYYIRLRLNSDPGWSNLKVILSDANVPGEGEHKIMSFIRLQRNLPGYDPNTLHCLYGLDADLIMLALATHEIHFTILREDVLIPPPAGDVTLALQSSFSRAHYEKLKTRESFGSAARMSGHPPKKPYQFVKIWTLRRFLEMDLRRIPDAPFEVDLERQIDDFIFMCFFMGNDFLPHIPSLEVHEEAIDLLLHVYKSQFKKIGGYLVDTSKMKAKMAAYIKAKHVERFLVAVGSFEEKIFEKRRKVYQRRLERQLRESLKSLGDDSEDLTTTLEQHSHASGIAAFVDGDRSNVLENTKGLVQMLRSNLKEKSDLFKHGSVNDIVKLGTPGWRERYMKEKFSVVSPEQTESIRKEVVTKYTEGLCWVLQYYFEGVSSWNWFYPFYYAPFASDIKGLNSSSVRFILGAPFKPFQQLMAVLPPRSAHALPMALQQLMTDPQSGLKEFYPTDFDVDLEGKRFLWQGTVKLPFIEEKTLLTETRKLDTELNEEEQRRNSSRLEKIFVLRSHSLGKDIWSLHQSHDTEAGKVVPGIAIDCNRSGGMNGFLCLSTDKAEGCHFTSPVNGMDDIIDDHVVSAFYQNPPYHDHVPKLLENVSIPLEEDITESDIVEKKELWHEQEFNSSWSQPCRGGHHNHHRSSPSNAARNNWRRGSPAPMRSDRASWKAAGDGQASTRSYQAPWKAAGDGPASTRSGDHESWKAAGDGWGGRGRGPPRGNGMQQRYGGGAAGVGRSGHGVGPSSSGGGRGSSRGNMRVSQDWGRWE